MSTEATRVTSATSYSVGADLSYPHGHLGHLTEHQQKALGEFKSVLKERGYYKAGPPPSHDETVLIRFLRARRWIVEDAYVQFKETEDWRAANDIDVLYRTIDLDAYEQSRRLYPQWTGRRDRRGIPLYVFEVRPLDSKTISDYERQGSGKTFSEAKVDGKTPSGLLRLFALYENLTGFAMPFCSQLQDRESPDVPITMSTNIVDISGVGLKQFWNLKSHMQSASQLATAHYPETLDRIFIIGAPVFFSTVWGWIKRWFDPITVSKIFVLSSSEVKPTLESFIEPRNIPKKYGGELDFSWGELPKTDPKWDGVVLWENGHKSFPTGPLLWSDSEDGKRLVCRGHGSKGGSKREEVICSVPKIWPAETEAKVDAVTNGKTVGKLTVDEKAAGVVAAADAPATEGTTA
ncbi:SEC14 [Geosmithia morbida]|uniref:SEC14 n=1 Tax=Geosmithia morbida TaxID=1094350 RepID=A0A9P4YWQ8_9HYPO|nr:SEC14 [Geosmithia morbida]KAF4123073.1 SEC14 [Geosmithia morbida]